jgi:hypothetical protein
MAMAMVPDDELRAYKRRADAGMLRIADAERLLMGLLAERQSREDAEQELRALRVHHEDDTALIALQRTKLARLKQLLASTRKELRPLTQREGLDATTAHQVALALSHLG